MSSDEAQPPRTLRTIVLGGALLAAALGGALMTRGVSPSGGRSTQRGGRPIVQIVRQQPGLPDIADVIDRLCPSVAIIVPHGGDGVPGSDGTTAPPAAAISADGWLVTSAAGVPPMPIDAIFGDGHRVVVTDVRDDPVSGLAIIKSGTVVAPLVFSDQAFPRVGQFGFALATPAGTGCSAASSMIGSDFLADGGSALGYVRVQMPPAGSSAGMPFVGSDGRVLGIATDNPAGAIIPAPIVSVVLDELIRNSLSPSTRFGFRAIDYSMPLATRLGDVRSGAGVALVEPKSPAARAGLQAGDIITAVDDAPVSSASELSRALDAQPSRAKLSIHRRSVDLELVIMRVSG